jgi:tetratricopeptide (TPR) repeat protein
MFTDLCGRPVDPDAYSTLSWQSKNLKTSDVSEYEVAFPYFKPSRLCPLLVFLPVLAAGTPTSAQQPTGPAAQGIPTATYATMLVSVRSSGGGPISGGAFVSISSDFTGVRQTAPTRDAGTATFPNIRTGDYNVEVQAAGYQTANERASMLASGSNFTVYVYMHPEGEKLAANGPPGKPAMAPRLQAEIDKGLDKMRHQQYDAARTHFDKAAKMAPGNPDVQYLLGMLEYSQQHLDLARAKFESALSIYPTHERALVSLGEIQLRSGQPKEATATLEKAFQVNGADWRTHYLLAYAYAGRKDYEKALTHAQRAAELGKERAAAAKVLEGRLLIEIGKRDAAKAALASVIHDFPNDPAAKDAAKMTAELEAPAPPAAETRPAAQPVAQPAPAPVPPPAPPAPVRPWAPPDVDSREYSLAPDVACSDEQILHLAELRTMNQLANLEKFSATEHIEHQEIDAYGNPGPVRDKNFSYLVFITRPRKGALFLDEQRDGGQNLGSFPTSLATRGIMGFGVFLFTPEYKGDLTYKCEGLGEWRGQAAWLMRFEQRKEVPSRMMTWRNNLGVYPVALKGRAWLAANSYDVVHIETDLREPIPSLELALDHLSIDYGPVKFEHGKTSLWLPWYAEMYMQLHGRRYHHRHTLSNYTLFSVDTNHQISAPRQTPAPN